jgi:hypothetical protein
MYDKKLKYSIFDTSTLVILTLPPHCSHKLQPLDVGVFYSFKVFIGYEHEKSLLNNPGKTITFCEIGEFVKHAYSASFTKENIESGFRATGIFPFNRNIFSEVDFLSSDVTDRPNMNATAENQELPLLQCRICRPSTHCCRPFIC